MGLAPVHRKQLLTHRKKTLTQSRKDAKKTREATGLGVLSV
jgi:hypothetical protein